MTTSLFPAFRTADPERLILLLTSLGFTERGLFRDEEDPAIVLHAEFAWGERGGLMFGSRRDDGSALDRLGPQSFYLVASSNAEVDRLHAVVDGLGTEYVSEIVREPEDQPYGGREFDFIDFAGNFWGVGSYAGA